MSWRPRNGVSSGHEGCPCYGAKATPVDEDRTEAEVFGEKAGYWEKYDLISDKYDADMMDRLNTGLDNLLIFVSLSSATLKRIC